MKLRQLNHPRAATAISMAVLLVVFSFSASRVVASKTNLVSTDFMAFWQASHLILNGGDPYDPAQWVAGCHAQGQFFHGQPFDCIDTSYLYPLALPILHLPFGTLRLDHSFMAFLLITQCAAAASVLLLLSTWGPGEIDRKHFVMPLLLALFVFRPFLAALLYGQYSGLLLFLAASSVVLWERGYWMAGGTVLAVLALKPGIGGPLVLLAALWLLRNRQWSALAGMAISGTGLAAIGLLYDPGWIGKFLAIGAGKMTAMTRVSTTLWGLSAEICRFDPACSVSTGAGLAAAAVLIVLISILVRPGVRPLFALGGMIAATLLATPYLWAYDQTLLVVTVVATVAVLRHRLPYLAAATYFLGLGGMALATLALAQAYHTEAWNTLPAVAALLAWALSIRLSEPSFRVQIGSQEACLI